jgi:hypothetical protein
MMSVSSYRFCARRSNSAVRCSNAEMLGTPNVLKSASSRARVVSNGKSTRMDSMVIRWWSATGSSARISARTRD